MKTMLSCDQVFDVLTQGPFPQNNARDDEVEVHLSICHSCRMLAEALRPAVHALGAAAADDASRSALPEYRGRLPSLASQTVSLASSIDEVLRREADEKPWRCDAVQQARLGQAEQTRKIAQQSARRAAQIAAISLSTAAVAIACAVMMWVGLSMSHGPDESPSIAAFSPSRVTATRPPSAEALVRLVSLNLPSDCRPAHSPLLEKASRHEAFQVSADFACCTRCHHSASRLSLGDKSLAVVAHSCIHCHES